MSFVKELVDDLNRDLSGVEPYYGENLQDNKSRPGEQELGGDENE